MAVVLMRAINRYAGLSTDTKPASSVAGSTFYETDTGHTYIWQGSAWLKMRE